MRLKNDKSLNCSIAIYFHWRNFSISIAVIFTFFAKGPHLWSKKGNNRKCKKPYFFVINSSICYTEFSCILTEFRLAFEIYIYIMETLRSDLFNHNLKDTTPISTAPCGFIIFRYVIIEWNNKSSFNINYYLFLRT